MSRRVLKSATTTLTPFSHPPSVMPKQIPNLTTTELLTKLGYIAQPNAGLTNWLPLGKQVLDNVSNIIHRHHQEAGCIEVGLSSMSHSSLWRKTGRWENGELFKLHETDFCLAATAEEEVTQLVDGHVDSYKKLPLLVYQLTRKYRNEKRARGGLLRGREFVMKDAYSFDANKEGALQSFNKMNDVYANVFDDLKLPWVKANADSGDIGGDLSYEWHIISDIGEDTVVRCVSCDKSSNVERAEADKHVDCGEGLETAREADVEYYVTKTKELVAIYWPKGRKLSMRFIKNEDLLDIDESFQGQNAIDVYQKTNAEKDDLLKIYRILDMNVGPGTALPDMPVTFSRNKMVTFDELDITEVQEGDKCLDCGGHMHEMKGVEVGHIFYLGKKYSEPMEASFVDSDGQRKIFEMGCYGIGVSRIVGVIAEIMRDDMGLVWPARLAPLQVSIIPVGEAAAATAAKQLSESLTEHTEWLSEVDTSEDIGFGKKIMKSKMLGVPLQVIIGKRYPHVEIEVRGKMFSENWRKLQQAGELDWHVEAEKHIVHISDAARVIDLLLQDM